MAELEGFLVSGTGYEYDGLELVCPKCRQDVLWGTLVAEKMILTLAELARAATDHRCTVRATATAVP